MTVFSGSFDELPTHNYDLIMADPPWHFTTRSPKGITAKGATGQYQTMTADQICDLPVHKLAANDCILWLWITNPLLPLGLKVMEDWGFEYKTGGHWSKKTKNGKQAFGTGYILRCAGEPFLIGTRGKPKTSRSVRSVIEGPIREHSRKPDEAFLAAETLVGDSIKPNVKRLELFSRQSRDGWDVWGNQATKFDET